MSRIYLSPPDVGPGDREALNRAFDGGWIAPLGPEVDAFEEELAAATGRMHAAALSSGTAAIHLSLLLSGRWGGRSSSRVELDLFSNRQRNSICRGRAGFCRQSPQPPGTWIQNILTRALAEGPYAACVPVDIYGQCASYSYIERMCADRGIPLIEDAAEALGATYQSRPAGSFGEMAALSFNGNKIITTSGGGALVNRQC